MSKEYLNSWEIGKEISCNFIDFISTYQHKINDIKFKNPN